MGSGSSGDVSYDGWWPQHAQVLKTLFRVIIGVVWLIDGSLKFASGFVDAFAGSISSDGQPAWLHGWFNFWATQVNGDPAFWVYLVGTLEILLGLALVFGFVRKIAYVGGALLSLFIWAVPEGFGGPYGPGSTDIGTGAVYALVFLALLLLNATYGPSRWSLDYLIERRVAWWAKVAELRGTRTGSSPPRARAE
jgi:uncharacterized membrane protein YphA (DoxX/SURF4 family)